jgi:hypothetical protein
MFGFFISIVEHSVLADPQLPNGRYVFPRWDQTHKNFAIARFPSRFVGQLYFDLIKDSGSFRRTEGLKIIEDRIRVRDLVHGTILSAKVHSACLPN